ncbi:MAG: SPOR domain-containing protein [Bacteroidaceae bacterium]|nr:SPOR domain-containing protein [Candidatus Colenecus caballi]MCQ2073339.1 SPOR domain-containing protein [Bacteroidaceae bacterium]
MKRNLFILLSAVTMLSLSACKSSQNAYKEAYEKAIQGDEPKTVVEEPVQNQTKSEVANVTVREEKVTVVSGDGIKAYGIVCGSFSLKANADALRQKLIGDGYPAVVVVNEAGKTYRVVVASYDTKEQAADAREQFKAKYPDNQDFQSAWLLYRK